MTTLRTAYKRAKRALRRKVYREAFAYHMARCARLAVSGRSNKLSRSSFIARQRRKDRILRKKERV